jgi:hypothetical protein
MSVTISIYLQRASMPSPTEWQSAIDAAGFPISLWTDFDVDLHTGFLPCKYRGQDSGFEYYAERVTALSPEIKAINPHLDFQVTLRFGSDLIECAAASCAGAALCLKCDAVIQDDGGSLLTGASAVESALRPLDNIEKESEKASKRKARAALAKRTTAPATKAWWKFW